MVLVRELQDEVEATQGARLPVHVKPQNKQLRPKLLRNQ
jgi:hypothetical protein